MMKENAGEHFYNLYEKNSTAPRRFRVCKTPKVIGRLETTGAGGDAWIEISETVAVRFDYEADRIVVREETLAVS